MKVVILVLVFLVLLSGCIGPAGCHAKGGISSRYGTCIIPTSDAGDYCDSPGDCEGQCVIPENETDGTCSAYMYEPISYSFMQ